MASQSDERKAGAWPDTPAGEEARRRAEEFSRATPEDGVLAEKFAKLAQAGPMTQPREAREQAAAIAGNLTPEDRHRERLLREVRVRVSDLALARQRRDEAIRAACVSVSQVKVAEAAGMSRARVQQILEADQ